MAAAKQSKPLTIDDLISAQQSIASSSTDESDIKKAEEQIERLMKLKGDSTHVTLGDVKTEIKGLREDLKKNAKGKAPAENRKPLLSLVDSQPKPAPAGVPGTDTADRSETRDARKERFLNLGEKIDQRSEASRGGARNETLTSKNKGTYEKFVAESGKKNEFMADATAKQTEIFQRIEDTLTQLRGAGSEDSAKLREELDKIANELHDTDDTKAKGKVSGILQNARESAATGTRGDKGTLGDAYAALRGKKDVLKEGFSRDSRTGTARNDKTGLLAGPEAKMGKLAGAASIFGNFIGNKVEESVESKRSPGLQKFLGNFKETELPEVTGAGAEHKIGTDQPKAKSAGSAIKGATDQMSVSTLNVTAKVVNINDGKPYAGAGGAKPAGKSEPLKAVNTPKARAAAPAPRAAAAPTPRAAPAAAAAAPAAAQATPAPMAAPATAAAAAPMAAPAATAAAPAEEGGSVLGTVADVATSGGGGMMSKAGSLLKGAAPGLLKGGAAALGGAALSYGGDKLKEAGYEKTGAAVDIAGQAASWGGTGAMIGSVVPGVGTAIGAGVGAVAGGAYGLYKNWGSLFGGDKQEPAVDGARAAGGPVVEGQSYLVGEKGPEVMTPQKSGKITPHNLADLQGRTVQGSSQDYAGNNVEDYGEGMQATRDSSGNIIKMSSGAGTTHFAGGKATRHDTASMMGYGESHDLETGAVTKKYDAGPMSTRETADATGKVTSRSASYDLGVAKVGMEEDLITGKKKATASATDASGNQQSVEGEDAQEVMGKLQVLLDAVDKANKSDSGSKIGGLSADNADAKGESSKPIIINQQAAAPAPAPQQTTMVPRGNVRPQESALDSYTGRSAHF
jgi:hypothetical protein